ncbi:DMT family transporter [Rhizobiales bacterium]|uniref:DMT family transporter n=1 Tax=Hongsoonwoonella zoysiae TaxID=2821844 RepID=UPI00155F70E3|nr:DMT family transporter [Hongsoonwoonella zoysiae]NRG19469.1 DMT family transporter [Hongsoonwoonella zoysiae]
MIAALNSQPVLLLTLTTLMWGGNTIAGRLAVGEVSPFAVVLLRWVIVAGLLVAIYGRQLVAEWVTLKRHLILIVLSATFGFTAFNSLFYLAAHSTTALNLGIIQGSMPMFVLLGALIFYRTPITPLQMAGVLITILGVIYISSRGELARLANLEINPGDGLMIIACFFYSAYAVTLRNRPKVPGIVFFTALAVVAAVTSVPAVVVEASNGSLQWPTAKGWIVVAYIALAPSFLSQIFFMRAIELIGPGRAGVFINLVPIFSSIMAVMLLSEPFRAYHAVALALVLAGIWLSERKSAAKAEQS